MHSIIFVLVVFLVCLNIPNANAEVKCYFQSDKTDTATRFVRLATPDKVQLQRADVGGVMATVDIPNSLGGVRTNCLEGGPYGYTLKDANSESGYYRVFKTGVRGVGVRIIDTASFYGPVPYISASIMLNNRATPRHRLEFVRTARDVAEGVSSMNAKMQYWMGSAVPGLNQWVAIEYSFAPIKFENLVFFSGCAGAKVNNIRLGKVAIAEIGKVAERAFNLDVVCSGMAPGTKVPVKVYFEGNSPGAGRLNLDPGGAEGVEISISTDSGALLPFSKGSALNMAWINSLPEGELYRLSIKAKYAKVYTRPPIVVGSANATLNYILEYN